MKKLILGSIILGNLILGVGYVALAVPSPKVYVCKYVNKPGGGETLQTGQNPISVSSNSIQNYQGVGSSFADAQGRSYVVAEDTGQPEPSCPVPQNPTPPPVTPPAPQTPPVVSPTATTPPATAASEDINPNTFQGK